MLKDFEIDPKYAKTMIGCKHNHITTCYFLLMKKLKRDLFPVSADTPRTLKQNKIGKFEQKYAMSFIEESKEKMTIYCEKDHHSKEHKDDCANIQWSPLHWTDSNDELNSSLK